MVSNPILQDSFSPVFYLISQRTVSILLRAVGIKECIAGLSLMSDSCSLSGSLPQNFPPRAQFHISAADPGGCSQAQHLPSAMYWCWNLGAVSQIQPNQQPFLGTSFYKSFFWPQKREEKKAIHQAVVCSVAMAGGSRDAKCFWPQGFGKKTPSKQCLKPCLDFFSDQQSGSSGFYIFLSRWEFSPASSTGTFGFREAFESREIAQPIFKLIDFCGWLKC